MVSVFAVECFADEDVVTFARTELGLPLQRLHSFSQGEVINDVFVRHRAAIGMVDEDPGKSHHQLRDQMQVVHAGVDLELRRRDGRHLVIVKPELEECFLRSMKRLDLRSDLGLNPRDIQAVLNIPKHPKHRVFCEELARLYRDSIRRKVATFVTELDALLRPLV